jgi:hypothetical protein
MNDDLVQGERGFGMHPHRDVEIVTYIVDGILTHADSMGTSESLGRGSVQFMTAGTGISHSEQNLEPAPLRFVQIWITPRRVGLKPRYGGYDGTTASAKAARTNALCQVVGDADNAAHAAVPVRIAQDCSMYVAEARATARSAASPAPPSIPKVPLRYSAAPTAAPIARSPQLEPSAHVEIKLGAASTCAAQSRRRVSTVRWSTPDSGVLRRRAATHILILHRKARESHKWRSS